MRRRSTGKWRFAALADYWCLAEADRFRQDFLKDLKTDDFAVLDGEYEYGDYILLDAQQLNAAEAAAEMALVWADCDALRTVQFIALPYTGEGAADFCFLRANGDLPLAISSFLQPIRQWCRFSESEFFLPNSAKITQYRASAF